jgi:beta-lactamase class C
VSTIDARVLDQLEALILRITSARPDAPFRTPGLAVVIERDDGATARRVAGTDATGRACTFDDLIGIASATKLATGLAVLRLVDRGDLELDAPVARWLPDARIAREKVTPRMLLAHTSGLPLEIASDAVSYAPGLDWRTIANACLDTPVQSAPGSRVQYSNVGYGLLAQIVERVEDAEFPEALQRLVIRPLGIEAYIGCVPPRETIMGVGIDSEHCGTELEPGHSPFWRRLGLPWAGLYTTLDGMLALLGVYAGRRPELLSAAVAREATRNQTGTLPGGFNTTDPFLGFRTSHSIAWPSCAWGLSVEVHGEKMPHWTPRSASAESFGQIGSSGCLAWRDPQRGVTWAFFGTHSTDNGWLLRHGAAIGNLALQAA